MKPQNSLALADCPDKPNCVCTQATRQQHKMAPLPFKGSAAGAIQQVVQQLEKFPRVNIVERRENYLQAVFSSLLFRFKDDVEFYADEQTGSLHFRSASRLGYSDFGVNRRRMEQLCQRLGELPDFQ